MTVYLSAVESILFKKYLTVYCKRFLENVYICEIIGFKIIMLNI